MVTCQAFILYDYDKEFKTCFSVERLMIILNETTSYIQEVLIAHQKMKFCMKFYMTTQSTC